MNLECSSRGDKRFSAFYAKVEFCGVVDSIENHYQKVKRDEEGCLVKKGGKVWYVVIKDCKLDVSYLSKLYKYLWVKYFVKNKELLEYARGFDTYSDMFRGKAINCQADVIRDICKLGSKKVFEECKEIYYLERSRRA